MRSIGWLLLCFLFVGSAPAAAREPWQLGHGPFLTAADVREHNQAALDWRDVRALVAKPDPDWAAALGLYAYGRHFKNHSLGIVADDYNGRFGAVLPLSTKRFGTASFQAHAWSAALMRTGRFRRASEPERIAFMDAAAPALMINWSRYELGEADRKAKLAEPNWALTNGSPKNWNEIFAFHYGPDGRHSVFEALAGAGGGEVNDRLLAALATGQTALVAKAWPEDAARQVRALLDRASLVLLRQALASGLEGDAALARQRAVGAWMAAAEAALAMSDLAGAIEPALDAKSDAAALRAALDAVSRALRE